MEAWGWTAEKSADPVPGVFSRRMDKLAAKPPPDSACRLNAFAEPKKILPPREVVEWITRAADGCSHFFATNSKGRGGTMFRLKDFSDLKGLDRPFLFDENTEEIRFELLRNYDREHSIWQSELFADFSPDEAAAGVWAAREYSLIPGVLPFAVYNDTGTFGMNTQALLVLNGPLKGQIWKATKFKLISYGEQETLYTWMIRMMEHGVI